MKIVDYCPVCHEPVYEGEDVYEMDGEYYHEDCFEMNAVEILKNLCGAFKTEAVSSAWVVVR